MILRSSLNSSEDFHLGWVSDREAEPDLPGWKVNLQVMFSKMPSFEELSAIICDVSHCLWSEERTCAFFGDLCIVSKEVYASLYKLNPTVNVHRILVTGNKSATTLRKNRPSVSPFVLVFVSATLESKHQGMNSGYLSTPPTTPNIWSRVYGTVWYSVKLWGGGAEKIRSAKKSTRNPTYQLSPFSWLWSRRNDVAVASPFCKQTLVRGRCH